MELITKDHEKLTAFQKTLDNIVNKFEQVMQNSRPLLNGEHFLSDRELSEKLKISRRALQDYRDRKKIPYLYLGGKVLYKESDIEKTLEKAYCKAH